MKKDALREELRHWLRAADPLWRRAASQRICRAIERTPGWRAAKLVCAFVPLPSEPQIQALWQHENGPAFCFPRIRNTELELIRIDERAHLHEAGWKLDTPEFSDCPRVAPAEVELILVPGLAFTRDGHRLGRGRGYYDRLLAQCPPRTVKLGVCFDAQIRDHLPTEPHDQRVDTVLTDASA